MSVDTRHPLYNDAKLDWDQLIHTYAGQRTVKSQGVVYLPATSGMDSDGMGTNAPGRLRYDAYKARAAFPSFVKDAVDAAVGIMHSKPAIFELPKRLEAMLENATLDGEGLEMLLRKVNEQQLKTGRVGLLVDIPSGASIGEVLPYIAMYESNTIINWDFRLTEESSSRDTILVVLDESGVERGNDLSWNNVTKYRVLTLGDSIWQIPDAKGDVYAVSEVTTSDGSTGKEINPQNFRVPSVGGTTLDKIPFVFVNSNDLVFEPDQPPFLSLSNLAITVYHVDADYRQALFMQGQDTLVIIGGEDATGPGAKTRTGSGAVIHLPHQSEAKYIGHEGKGLEELRKAIENDTAKAGELGARILDQAASNDGSASGEALKTRVGSRTTTLNTIARSGAGAVEQALRYAAEWVGANPDEVKVIPNLDFQGVEGTGKELLDLVGAKLRGAPISIKTIHDFMAKKEMTDLSFDDEMDEIDNEVPVGLTEPGTEGGTGEGE